MGNKDLKIQETDFEPVSRLLGELKRVEAPNDFDFRVRARIADGKPAERTATLVPASIRIALPLALLLIVGGYFAFNAFYSPNKDDVPVVADSEPVSVAPMNRTQSNDPALPSDEIVSDRRDAKIPESETKLIPNGQMKTNRPTQPKSDHPAGGSMDQAVREGRRIYPRGLNPSSKVLVKPKEFDQNAQVSARELFSLIGIEANYSGSLWTIGAVKPNSMGERSGVKAGDAIEAVNDLPLTEKTVFGNGFTGKSLRIRRDGRSMTIDLKP
jgi:membrane-associated protease RseP (regulator of RpoE activity)